MSNVSEQQVKTNVNLEHDEEGLERSTVDGRAYSERDNQGSQPLPTSPAQRNLLHSAGSTTGRH